jgi:hypothetical protein
VEQLNQKWRQWGWKISPNPQNPNNCYPWCNSQLRGGIGEYGFDCVRGRVIDPEGPTYDYMSQCTPNWVSPYTYIDTINSIANSQYIQRPLLTLTSRISNEILFLDFEIIEEGRKIHLNYGYQISDSNFAVSQKGTAEFSCKLLDDQRITLQSGACHVLDHPHRDYSQSLFGVIPWNPKAKSLELYRNGECIYTRMIQDEEPRVCVPTVNLEEAGKGLARVEWKKEEEYLPRHESLRYMLRYSNDHGNSWRAMQPI